MTNDRIRRAFEKWFPATHNSKAITNSEKFFFVEGYKAALASLEPVNDGLETLYRIKEKS